MTQQEIEQAKAFGQLLCQTNMEICEWLLTERHERPAKIVVANPMQLGSDAEYKRMSDEYDLLDRAIAIYKQAQDALVENGIPLVSYEQQAQSRLNYLLHPEIKKTLQVGRDTFVKFRESNALALQNNSAHKQQVDKEIRMTEIHLQMIQQLELLTTAYPHLFVTNSK